MTTDASVPGQFPTQDQIDRAAHVALITRLDLDLRVVDIQSLDTMAINKASAELHDNFPRFVSESIDTLFPRNQMPELVSRHYQVGPAAGGIADLSHIIVTILERADQLSGYLDHVPTYWFFYSIAVAAKRRATRWVQEQNIPGINIIFAYTPEDLKLLAEGYVQGVLGVNPINQTIIHCLTEDFYDGYQSPSHPTESLEYLVIVPTTNGTYRFRVMGDSRILELVAEDDNGARTVKSLEYLDEDEVME